MSSKLRIMDFTGHTEVAWETESILGLEVAPDTEKARQLFGEYMDKGYMAFEVIGKERKITNEFNPLADSIVMSPRLAGG